MPRLGYYVLGDYNATCDVCGRGFKFSDLQKRWDNAWCCDSCWEIRQPQDFVRGVKDDQSVPVGRPRIGLPSESHIALETQAPSNLLMESNVGVFFLLLEQ